MRRKMILGIAYSWLDEARGAPQGFPEFDGSLFLEWVAVRRERFACSRPSPMH